AHHSRAEGWHGEGLLPKPPGTSAIDPHADIDDAGNILLGWSNTVAFEVFASSYRPASGWEMPETMSDIAGLGAPQAIAGPVAANGDAIFFFRDSETYAFPSFKYRRRPAGGDFLPLERLQDPGRVGEPNLTLRAAYNKAGQGIISWQEASDLPAPEGGLYFVD